MSAHHDDVVMFTGQQVSALTKWRPGDHAHSATPVPWEARVDAMTRAQDAAAREVAGRVICADPEGALAAGEVYRKTVAAWDAWYPVWAAAAERARGEREALAVRNNCSGPRAARTLVATP